MLARMGWLLVLVVAAAQAADAQEYVNGYTYVAPSYYLTPPVYAPAIFDPYPGWGSPAIEVPGAVLAPRPLPFVVAPYPTAPVYRGRIVARPREAEYTLRNYGPVGPRVYSYEVNARPRGYVVRERIR